RLHVGMLDDSWHRDHLVAAHDERPRLALGSRDLGVDEHVLDLLAAPREPVAGTPRAYLKAWQLRLDVPWPPADLAVEREGGPLDPGAVVLAHERAPTAEVEALRARGRVEEVGDGRRHRPSLREAVEVSLG